MLAAGCGGGAEDATSPFVGHWTFTTGLVSPTCPAGADPQLGGFRFIFRTVDIGKLDVATLGVTIDSAACVLRMSVNGATATADAAQTCALPLLLVSSATAMTDVPPVTIDAATMAVGPDGLGLEMTGTAGSCPPSGDGSPHAPRRLGSVERRVHRGPTTGSSSAFVP